MRLGGAVGGLGPTSTAATRNRKSKLFAQYCSLIASIWLLISAVSSSGFSTDPRTRRKGFGNSGKGNGKMLLAILAVLLTAPLASGEWVEPRLMEDAPFKNASSGLVMSTEDSGGSFRVRVEPMTSAVGLGRPETFIENFNLSGILDYYYIDKRGSSRGAHSDFIAFINCDHSGGRRNASVLLESVVRLKYKAVVFFTTEENHYCHYLGTEELFGAVFTTASPSKARSIEDLVSSQVFSGTAVINYDPKYTDEENPEVKGPAATATVALLVVYAFAGLIVVLFALVVIFGVIRAHRNPDRYGPRRVAMNGRPRQSRARGLARAVLDTIPIVRFNASGAENVGTVTEQKTHIHNISGDIEMAPSKNQVTIHTRAASTVNSSISDTLTRSSPISENGSEIAVLSSSRTLTAQEGGTSTSSATPSTNEVPAAQLQCPVCQDDFESGQQLRILPCLHSFHQHCIDPWLLNVSGSCPLCRVDLRPEDARRSFQMPPEPTEPLPRSQPRFIRYLEVYSTTAPNSIEREQALRAIRAERVGRSAVPELGFTRLGRFIKKKVGGEGSRDSDEERAREEEAGEMSNDGAYLSAPMTAGELERQLSRTHR